MQLVNIGLSSSGMWLNRLWNRFGLLRQLSWFGLWIYQFIGKWWLARWLKNILFGSRFFIVMICQLVVVVSILLSLENFGILWLFMLKCCRLLRNFWQVWLGSNLYWWVYSVFYILWLVVLQLFQGCLMILVVYIGMQLWLVCWCLMW